MDLLNSAKIFLIESLDNYQESLNHWSKQKLTFSILQIMVAEANSNFAAGEYEDAKGRSLVLENPVKRLSHTRAWYRVERRQTVIKPNELAAWYQAVVGMQDERSTGKTAILRDYFLLILFTGLRRDEAIKITWDQIDLVAKTLTISDTKNHQKHVLPLSDFLYNLFLSRQKHSAIRFVFPGNGKTGYIVEPRKAMQKIISKS